MRSVSFERITRTAQKLKVADVVRSAFRLRDNVIHGEIAKFEMFLAAVAVAALLAVEPAFVLRIVVANEGA